MTTPKPTARRGGWTWDDHLENARLVQSARDGLLWSHLARILRVSPREFKDAFGRMVARHAEAVVAERFKRLDEAILNPATADAVRNAIVDVIADDIAEMIHILTRKRRKHDSRNTQEATRSGGANAADGERPLHAAGELDDAGEQPGQRRAAPKRPRPR